MNHTDIFVKIGAGHKVCEDYIVSGEIDSYKYIILSDGCSSSENTEMGARILCHLAKQYLKYRVNDILFPILNYNSMGAWIIHNSEFAARQMGLNKSCLNATLIISITDGIQYYTYMYGDGVILKQDKNNNISYIEIEFSKNAPFYLQYKIDESAFKEYHNMRQDIIIKESRFATVGDSGIDNIIRNYAYDYETVFTFKVDDYKTLAICSDGITSFVKDKVDPVNILDIATEFLSFKHTAGEFLTRRLNKALKEYEKNSIQHNDDLSIGAFVDERV